MNRALSAKLSQIIAVFLILVLGGNMLAQPGPTIDVRAQVSGLAIGTKIDVQLKGGERLSGRFSSSDQNGFTLMAGRSKTQRVVAFQDTERVVAHKPTHTPAIAWIATGAIVAVVVIVVVAIGIERHN